MRIHCPFCGERDAQEFTYRGDARPKRPDPAAPGADRAFYDYVYLRDNPAGPIDELWYHGAGCRAWLVVTRDTRTHLISDVRLADRGVADQGPGSVDGESAVSPKDEGQ